jgi:hypothetical protein
MLRRLRICNLPKVKAVGIFKENEAKAFLYEKHALKDEEDMICKSFYR